LALKWLLVFDQQHERFGAKDVFIHKQLLLPLPGCTA
jgi:hypothetical protein